MTAPSPTPPASVPLPAWAAEFARFWNSGAHTMFLLQGNIFDIFPLSGSSGSEYGALSAFVARRLFPTRGMLMYFDLGDGLTFASGTMQQRFFEWLKLYDEVERTNYHQEGPPRGFLQLAPLLRRFFLYCAEQTGPDRGATLVLSFPEKLVPATDEAGASVEERMALVTLLKWASAPELQHGDIGVILLVETAAELHADLIQHPAIASIHVPLPALQERRDFLDSAWLKRRATKLDWSDPESLTAADLAQRTSGLSLLRIEQFVLATINAGQRLTIDSVSRSKRRLIEDYCQGLVRFKDPRPNVSLDLVATHTAAKARLRELAWLIREQKHDVLERGVLIPGRVGVGKSFLIDCFASECGLPVLEIGEFRSKWVGETERQQARILLTIRALGPVIVVVDEADAVFGNRSNSGDSGVSTRVFAAFASHLGDSSLRGRELWIAMTSRPDLLAIDMKRQGRFGLCVPLFAAQNADEVVELFNVIARVKKITLSDEMQAYVRSQLGERAYTGSDVESILVRTKERAVLARRDTDVQIADLQEAAESFIDPLDQSLLALQELAAVLACSDRRYLPDKYRDASRDRLADSFRRLQE